MLPAQRHALHLAARLEQVERRAQTLAGDLLGSFHGAPSAKMLDHGPDAADAACKFGCDHTTEPGGGQSCLSLLGPRMIQPSDTTRNRFKRSALERTLTLEKAMAKAAKTGESRIPRKG